MIYFLVAYVGMRVPKLAYISAVNIRGSDVYLQYGKCCVRYHEANGWKT